MSTSGKPCVVRKLFSFVSPICLGLAAIYGSSQDRRERRPLLVPSSRIKDR